MLQCKGIRKRFRSFPSHPFRNGRINFCIYAVEGCSGNYYVSLPFVGNARPQGNF
jgi:hypothetical protein